MAHLPPTHTQQTPAPTLSILPTELLSLISTHLICWPSLKSLRQTNSLFSTLLPFSALKSHYTTIRAHIHITERSHRTQIEQEFWEAAEESFQGFYASSWSSSSLDPDIRAHAESKTCLSSTLPCYRCLQWLPSHTDSPAFEAKSAFSRGMCTGTRDLGGSKALERMCIACGVKMGVYALGTIVKHSVVCFRCGRLGEPGCGMAKRRKMREGGERWRNDWFCVECCELTEVLTLTEKQLWHELRWRKYEDAMVEGKKRRQSKGLLLRAETEQCLDLKRITDRKVTSSHSDPVSVAQVAAFVKPRYCPVMFEMRLCHCLET